MTRRPSLTHSQPPLSFQQKKVGEQITIFHRSQLSKKLFPGFTDHTHINEELARRYAKLFLNSYSTHESLVENFNQLIAKDQEEKTHNAIILLPQIVREIGITGINVEPILERAYDLASSNFDFYINLQYLVNLAKNATRELQEIIFKWFIAKFREEEAQERAKELDLYIFYILINLSHFSSSVIQVFNLTKLNDISINISKLYEEKNEEHKLTLDKAKESIKALGRFLKSNCVELSLNFPQSESLAFETLQTYLSSSNEKNILVKKLFFLHCLLEPFLKTIINQTDKSEDLIKWLATNSELAEIRTTFLESTFCQNLSCRLYVADVFSSYSPQAVEESLDHFSFSQISLPRKIVLNPDKHINYDHFLTSIMEKEKTTLESKSPVISSLSEAKLLLEAKSYLGNLINRKSYPNYYRRFQVYLDNTPKKLITHFWKIGHSATRIQPNENFISTILDICKIRLDSVKLTRLFDPEKSLFLAVLALDCLAPYLSITDSGTAIDLLLKIVTKNLEAICEIQDKTKNKYDIRLKQFIHSICHLGKYNPKKIPGIVTKLLEVITQTESNTVLSICAFQLQNLLPYLNRVEFRNEMVQVFETLNNNCKQVDPKGILSSLISLLDPKLLENPERSSAKTIHSMIPKPRTGSTGSEDEAKREDIDYSGHNDSKVNPTPESSIIVPTATPSIIPGQ